MLPCRLTRLLHERSTQILIDLDEAARIATAQQASPVGLLRIYTNTVIDRFLAPMVAEFLALYPAVSVDLLAQRFAEHSKWMS